MVSPKHSIVSGLVFWLIVAKLTGLLLFAYGGFWRIPFLYDDMTAVSDNPVVGDIRLFWERMVTWKGFFQRPLSILSLSWQFHWHGNNPLPFHLFNFTVHLLNGVLLGCVATKLLGWSRVLGMLAAGLFLLHPLATSCASLVASRAYSMGLFFALLGTLFLGGRQVAIACLFWLLACLSKQTFVVWPLALWVGLGMPISRSWVVGCCVGLAVTACFVLHYGVPFSATAAIAPDLFLKSQIAFWPRLLEFFALPWRMSVGHEVSLYSLGWYSPAVMSGLLVIVIAVMMVIRFRSHCLARLVGGWLILVVPTNSFLPKDQLFHEPRLYPALAAWVLVLVAGLLALFRQRERLVVSVGILVLFVYSFITAKVNDRYSEPIKAYEQMRNLYPASPKGWFNYGSALAQTGAKEQAAEALSNVVDMGYCIPKVKVVVERLDDLSLREKFRLKCSGTEP